MHDRATRSFVLTLPDRRALNAKSGDSRLIMEVVMTGLMLLMILTCIFLAQTINIQHKNVVSSHPTFMAVDSNRFVNVNMNGTGEVSGSFNHSFNRLNAALDNRRRLADRLAEQVAAKQQADNSVDTRLNPRTGNSIAFGEDVVRDLVREEVESFLHRIAIISRVGEHVVYRATEE
jgi:hypothetical protein